MRGDFNLLDIGQIYLNARDASYQNARSQWEMERANRMDQRQAEMQARELAQDESTKKAAAERNKALFEAIKHAKQTGDTSMIHQVDPGLGLKYDEALQSGKEKKQAASIESERIATNLQRAMASAPTPEARAALEQRAYEMQRAGLIPRTEITGPETTPEQAASLGASADSILSILPSKDPKTTGNITDYEYAQAHPGFTKFQLEQAKAKAMQVNVGGKDLPASSVAELGDIDFLRQGVGDLLGSFKSAVPSGGMVEQGKSRIAAEVPNSDVANYNQQADMFAQKLGTTLEGGKLTDADYQSKYRNMVPRPGDSPETAQKKVANIDALLAGYGSARESAYGRAGYRPPSPKKGSRARAPAKSAIPPHLSGFTPAELQQLQQEAAAGDQAAQQLLRGGAP